MTHPALIDLPEAVYLIAPRLRDVVLDDEKRATCSSCAMLPRNSGAHPDSPWAFHPVSRCCTYIPHVPNWMVGRGLLRDDDSSDRLRAAFRPERLTAWGLIATEQERHDYEHVVEFGRTHTYRCPYFVESDLTCGIWKDRPAVCRTWHCKYERGRVGRDHWMDLKAVLHGAQSDLAQYCVSTGTPPPQGASQAAWEAWFKWCARRIEAFSPMEAEVVRGDISRAYGGKLGRHRARPILPDVVAPSVSGWEHEGDTVWFWGYSRYDGYRHTPDLFAFLAALDGKRTWREAREHAGIELSDDDVFHLYRVSCLKTPNASDLDDPRLSERPSLLGISPAEQRGE